MPKSGELLTNLGESKSGCQKWQDIPWVKDIYLCVCASTKNRLKAVFSSSTWKKECEESHAVPSLSGCAHVLHVRLVGRRVLLFLARKKKNLRYMSPLLRNPCAIYDWLHQWMLLAAKRHTLTKLQPIRPASSHFTGTGNGPSASGSEQTKIRAISCEKVLLGFRGAFFRVWLPLDGRFMKFSMLIILAEKPPIRGV